ncbi:MAG: type IX secretion system membrane protein PorP/SprF [Cytophagaceae bacterium]|nr:type IX secretion system membrane protein PorP/SprF [Cytophagaceae bacterium]MBK9510213.1 type IX secretion system membrane protein PorP/SprF [Cytophagaceae bacterium]MBL0301201.1 type IX secretion system membrane protein PorP/SprF [Cytophagaceae bacterium]
MKNLYFARKRVLLLVSLLFGSMSSLFAQQEVMYSQYMFNTLALNPAYAGSRDVLSLTAVGRYQWMQSIDGAPRTHSFTLDMPIRNEKMGIGLIAYNDAIGVAANTGINLAYSYRFKLGAKTTMALGVQPTYSNVSQKLSEVKNLDITEAVFANDITSNLFNAGMGLYLSNDKAFFSFSVPQIIEQKYGTSDSAKGKIRRHYFAMAGIVIGKGNVKVKPSVMMRYSGGSNMGFDLNANVWFKDKIAVGVSGRKSQTALYGQDFVDAIVGMFEVQLTPQLRLGYAYDYNTTRLNTKNGTLSQNLISTPTHEWLLRYEFGYGKSKILTPRYF